MPSTFTWLDYSERDRQRAIEVVDLFHMPGTVDELGVGSIRDALADLLSPGTSTIQTRARYFVFVPWFFRAHNTSEPGFMYTCNTKIKACDSRGLESNRRSRPDVPSANF